MADTRTVEYGPAPLKTIADVLCLVSSVVKYVVVKIAIITNPTENHVLVEMGREKKPKKSFVLLVLDLHAAHALAKIGNAVLSMPLPFYLRIYQRLIIKNLALKSTYCF